MRGIRNVSKRAIIKNPADNAYGIPIAPGIVVIAFPSVNACVNMNGAMIAAIDATFRGMFDAIDDFPESLLLLTSPPVARYGETS